MGAKLFGVIISIEIFNHFKSPAAAGDRNKYVVLLAGALQGTF
jgi:hypothetical protein